MEEMRKGKISFIFACLLRIKLKLPIDVTSILSVKVTSGIAKLLMLKMAMSAV
jgi:hypothetical protein